MKHETWNKSSQKRKSFEKLHSFKHELKITFFVNFLRLTEEVETLVKNGGVSIHTW